jgi:hypothetical protein
VQHMPLFVKQNSGSLQSALSPTRRKDRDRGAGLRPYHEPWRQKKAAAETESDALAQSVGWGGNTRQDDSCHLASLICSPDQASIAQLKDPVGSLVDVGIVAGNHYRDTRLAGDPFQQGDDARTGY